jgi:hypothetical protein
MSMASFRAGTQYGDWDGAAAADEYGDNRSFDELFEATGKVDKDKDLLIGFEFYAGEGSFFLTGYFHPKPKSDSTKLGWIPSLNEEFSRTSRPIRVRKVDVEVTRDEFFKYFKRFNVVMVHRGFDIIGRDFEIEESSDL